MDIRVKTFVLEAANRLEFLRADYGSVGPEVVQDESSVYPLLRRVRYESSDRVFEVSLVLSYMSEEYVSTNLLTEDRGGSVRRTPIGSECARRCSTITCPGRDRRSGHGSARRIRSAHASRRRRCSPSPWKADASSASTEECP